MAAGVRALGSTNARREWMDGQGHMIPPNILSYMATDMPRYLYLSHETFGGRDPGITGVALRPRLCRLVVDRRLRVSASPCGRTLRNAKNLKADRTPEPCSRNDTVC